MYIYILLYVVLLLAFTAWASKNKNNDYYLVAGRSSKTFNILASKFAGAIGVSTFITYTGYAYQFGFGVFALLIGGLVGYSLFALWAAPKVNLLASQNNFTSQGELAMFSTGNENSKLVTNWVTVLIQFFWTLIALVGGAKVIAMFGLMSYEIAVVVTGLVILSYILMSGLKAVILTDLIQSIIIILFLILIVIQLIDSPSTVQTFSKLDVDKLSIGKIIGLTLYGGLSVFGMADRYQLCFAANNAKTAKKGMGLAILPVIVVASLLMLVGLNVLHTQQGLDPDSVFVYAMQNQLSPVLLPVLLMMFFAGLMSSADTSIFAVSVHLSANVKSDNKIQATRKASVLLVVVAIVIALFWENIIDITIVGAALRLVLAIPMIYILKEKKNHGRFIGSVGGGILGLTIGLIVFGPEPQLAITTLLGTLLGLIYRKKAA